MQRFALILTTAMGLLVTCLLDMSHGGLILPSDLIAYWALDGDLTDSAPAIKWSSGSGSAGAFTGGLAPTFVTIDGRLSLNMLEATVGDNFVETQTFLDGGPKTVVLWANTTHTGDAFWAGNRCTTSNRLFFGTYGSSNRLWLGAGGSSSTNNSYPTSPSDGSWHMYVLTDTGKLGGASGTVALYQDGQMVGALEDYSGSTASQSGTRPFVIGQAGGATPHYARAYVDDVAVFNRVLTADEMARIYSTGSVSAAMDTYKPPMPTFSWLFDGNATAQLGGIDGTLATATSGGALPAFAGTAPDPPLSYPGNEYMQFDSTQQYVNFGNDSALRLTDAITVAFWMNSEVSSSTRFMLGQYTGTGRSWALGTYGSSGVLRLLLSADNSWGSGTNSKDYFSTSSVTDGEWHHVAFSFADNETRLYIDGAELTVGSGLTKSVDGVINNLNNSSANLVAGMRSDGLASSYYEGLMDEVAIWNSVLSADEIAWLYQSSIYAIPEPSTTSLLLLALAPLVWRRRRRCMV